MRLSLGAVLAICLAGLQFLAVSFVVFSSYVTSEQALLEHARTLLSDVGRNTIAHSKGFLTPAEGAAELATRLAENRIVSSENRALLEKLLFQQLRTAPQFAGLYYGDENGNFVYVMRSDGPGPFRSKLVSIADDGRSTQLIWRDEDYAIIETQDDPADKYDPRARPWYIDAVEANGSVWTDPYIFFSSQKPGITVASRVQDEGGSVRGVIGVDIEINAISNFLSSLHIGNDGVALIMNDNGDVVAHPDPELIKAPNNDGTLRFKNIGEIDDPIAQTAFGYLANSGAVAVETETYAEFQHAGEAYVSTVMPIISDQLPWTIAVYAPKSDFVGAITANRQRNIGIAVGIAAITALVGLALANHINKPVRAFAVRAALVSQGEISESEPMPRTYRELEQANATLVKEIAQRKKTEQEYGRTFELTSRGMAQIDPTTGQFARVNAALSEMLGYPAEKLLDLSVQDLLYNPSNSASPTLMKTLLDGSEYDVERRYLRKDGEPLWLRVNAILIRDQQGTPLHAFATFDDVTQLRQADAKIRELNHELAHFGRVNLMGQLAAGLAHELNQPLTAITQNVDAALMIVDDMAPSGQVSEMREVLSEVDQEAHRAADIIRALRGFVRKGERAISPFDLRELVEQSWRLVTSEANEKGVEIRIEMGDLPMISAVRIQIAQVFVNLFRNAIQAIGGTDTNMRRITVSARQVDKMVEIAVEDTGPGIAEGTQIFQQFETTKDQGMGLGLWISRSIVNDNGGELWHDPEVTRGARMCLTLQSHRSPTAAMSNGTLAVRTSSM